MGGHELRAGGPLRVHVLVLVPPRRERRPVTAALWLAADLAPWALIAAFAVLMTVVARIWCRQIDDNRRLRAENRRLRKQVDQRGRSADRWMERAGIAEQALAAERQQWFAEADELLAREQRHAARCPWAAADPETARSN